MCLRGGGSLKASLARVFSLAKFKGCLVGLKAQHTADSHMLSLREGQSPTKQSIQKSGLPRILTNARNDIAGQGGILTRLMAVCNDRSVGRSERAGLNSHKALSPYQLIALTPLAKAAFTMAEILLSLTIIGVVAAITLPSLTGNINERTWNTQRKALYSRMSQAIALMPSINGYGSFSGSLQGPDDAQIMVYCTADAGETFLTNGLGKVLKINNVCGGGNIGDCGISDEIIRYGGNGKLNVTSGMFNINQFNVMYNGGQHGMTYGVDGHAAAFETANGESLLVHYNPLCKNGEAHMMQGYDTLPTVHMCVNFMYDLNGKKGPNAMGKDVGIMSVFYPSDPVLVMPLPFAKDTGSATWTNAAKMCTSMDTDARVPNKEEIMSMAVNVKFMDDSFQSGGSYWTASPHVRIQDAWSLDVNSEFSKLTGVTKTNSKTVRCIKRFNS